MPTFYNFTEGGRVYSFDDTFVLRDSVAEGQIFTWGLGSLGTIGDNTTQARSTPKQEFTTDINWIKLANRSGENSFLAIKSNGTLWGWGNVASGSLGDGSTSLFRSTPRQEATSSSNWIQVSTSSHSAGIKGDGSLWTWGRNNYGQLGEGTSGGGTERSIPRQISLGASGIYGWERVECGGEHTIALRADGTLWAWGRNNNGQIGDNTTGTNRVTPRQISSGTGVGINGWTQVSAGVNFSAALRSDGTLWLWGENNFGQIGDNTIIPRSIPIQEVTLSTNWKQLSCNFYTSAAVKTNGTLWCWGRNNYGQVGDNTILTRSTPRQEFSASTNWKQVSSGGTHTAAVKTNGTLWVWGSNASGQIGDNTSSGGVTGANSRSTPRQEFTAGTNWKQVACSTNSTSAIKYT